MKNVWWDETKSQFGKDANLEINILLEYFFRFSCAYAKIQG